MSPLFHDSPHGTTSTFIQHGKFTMISSMGGIERRATVTACSMNSAFDAQQSQRWDPGRRSIVRNAVIRLFLVTFESRKNALGVQISDRVLT